MCGEKKKAEEMGATTKGSPPRMRGKGSHLHSVWESFGITPAYAGKRLSLFGKTYPEQDHSRVCGEK